MSAVSLREETLAAFITRAVRATFVTDGAFERVRGVKTRSYHEGTFSFEDRYTGNLVDTGLSMVWLDDVPVWALSYRGGVHLEFEHLASRVFAFLREALENVGDGIVPARGPSRFSKETWTYTNNVSGALSSFRGEEVIHLESREVYWRWYCGGLVRDRRHPILLR